MKILFVADPGPNASLTARQLQAYARLLPDFGQVMADHDPSHGVSIMAVRQADVVVVDSTFSGPLVFEAIGIARAVHTPVLQLHCRLFPSAAFNPATAVYRTGVFRDDYASYDDLADVLARLFAELPAEPID